MGENARLEGRGGGKMAGFVCRGRGGGNRNIFETPSPSRKRWQRPDPNTAQIYQPFNRFFSHLFLWRVGTGQLLLRVDTHPNILNVAISSPNNVNVVVCQTHEPQGVTSVHHYSLFDANRFTHAGCRHAIIRDHVRGDELLLDDGFITGDFARFRNVRFGESTFQQHPDKKMRFVAYSQTMLDQSLRRCRLKSDQRLLPWATAVGYDDGSALLGFRSESNLYLF